MRVLDLDLDFFLDYIALWRSEDGSRLSDTEYIPWSEGEVREFLENQCRLSTNRQVKGRFVTHHHEAFLFWRDLVLKGQLTTPFELVHVDAHSDTGVGDNGYLYIMTQLLHQAPAHRIKPKKLYAGNYISYAIACRWVEKLTFVLHPQWENDLQWAHLKDFSDDSGAFQLKKYSSTKLTSSNLDRMSEIKPDALEPEVPYELVDGKQYVTEQPFDFMVLAHSPGYTPPGADRLIPIIKEYMREI